MAAAFNTPLAAVTFVLEEIVDDLNSRLLGRILLASMVGALVTYWLIGPQPAFSLGVVEKPSWLVLLLAPVIAAFAALCGVLFQKTTLGLRGRVVKRRLVAPPLQPALGAAMAWVLGITVFVCTGHSGIFGLGYDDPDAGAEWWHRVAACRRAALRETRRYHPLLWLWRLRRNFFPNALLWLHVRRLSWWALGKTPAARPGGPNYAGHRWHERLFMSAVVRAPVTSIVIVFEMTHEFALVPALMLGAIAAQSVARRLAPAGFYESVLRQDGHELERVIPPRDLDSWQSLPVSTIANFKPVTLPIDDAAAMKDVLLQHRYQTFPVIGEKKIAGLVSRIEAEAALAEQRAPTLQTPTLCLPHQTINDLQNLLVESALHFVVILDKPEGRMIAVITLHDLLRAQMALAGRGSD